MKVLPAELVLAVFLTALVSGCRGDLHRVSRSSDDVNICRQFVAEAEATMLELKRDSFRPRDLTIRQLRILTPADKEFVQAEFLVLNKEWRFENDGKKVVIICARGRIDEHGSRKYSVAYNNGGCKWLSEDELSKLQLSDFSVLPKIQ